MPPVGVLPRYYSLRAPGTASERATYVATRDVIWPGGSKGRVTAYAILALARLARRDGALRLPRR